MTTEVPEKTKIDSHHVKMMVSTESPEITTEDLEITTEDPDKIANTTDPPVEETLTTEVPEMTTEDLEITTEDPDQTINQTELHEERVLKIKLKEISYKTNQLKKMKTSLPLVLMMKSDLQEVDETMRTELLVIMKIEVREMEILKAEMASEDSEVVTVVVVEDSGENEVDSEVIVEASVETEADSEVAIEVTVDSEAVRETLTGVETTVIEAALETMSENHTLVLRELGKTEVITTITDVQFVHDANY